MKTVCAPSMIRCTPSSMLVTLASTPFTASLTSSTLSTTPFILSSTVYVTFRFSAMAIRASSCVNLSNFFSASSISVLPVNLFRYFSEKHLVNDAIFAQISLTRSALLDLLRRNPKNREDLHHDFHHHIHHFGSWWNLRVDFETPEKVFDPFEDVNESICA